MGFVNKGGRDSLWVDGMSLEDLGSVRRRYVGCF